MKTQVKQHLTDLQIAMRLHNLWESTPPAEEALASDEPFCVSTLSATQWLQWIFIPRMQALLDANSELPRNFAITPYLEEALKDEQYLSALHSPLLKLEQLLKR
ncbi:MAG: YqcC family protein [Pasteurellaceae bacterium]|nr:YqcC family protein [Pasteurellaceae bacterium]